MAAKTIFIVRGMDPYEEHDRPSIESVFATREAAEKYRVARFEYTFGKGSAATKNSHGHSFMIDDYYEIEEHEMLTEWIKPDWMKRGEE